MFFHGSTIHKPPFRYPYVHVMLQKGDDYRGIIRREMLAEDTAEDITKIFELPPDAHHQDLLACHRAISTVYQKNDTLEFRFYDATEDGGIHSYRYHSIDSPWEDTHEEQPWVILTLGSPTFPKAFTQPRCELCCEKCCVSIMWARICQDQYLYRSDAHPEESLAEIRSWLRTSYILDRNPQTIDPEDFHCEIPVCVLEFIDWYTREYHVSGVSGIGQNQPSLARQLF